MAVPDSTIGQELEPTIFVLYGATGDLAKRMVLPAFFTLAQRGLLPADWRLVGNGRGDVAHEGFRQHVYDVLTEFGPSPQDGPWDEFCSRLLFAGGGFSSDDPGSLLDVLKQARVDMGANPRHVHYFAVPPTAFADLTRGIGKHGLVADARVVYEKPYGTSPESFRELDETVHAVLDESQVFRIDHFLGKEATQDLHVLRFANGIVAGMWDREHVAAVQIDVPETLDITDRAEFYDTTGAVRDMLVTHLFQVAAEVAMEPPVSLGAANLQDARAAIVSAFRPLDPAEVVIGQFAGYRDVEGVAADSTTETFVAARLWVDTDRWHGVPFLLRTGKRMAADGEQVSLVLRRPDGPLTHLAPDGNVLSLSLAGDGALALSMLVKAPGPTMGLARGTARLDLDDVSPGDPLPPYAALISDVLRGDRSLFTTTEGLAAAWRAVEPVLTDSPPLHPYAPGSWGPQEATALAAPTGWLLGP